MPQFERPVSERVIREIAATTDTDMREFPPLYQAIDPEALDTVVETMSNGVVSFTYLNQEITVTNDGSISVESVSDNPI